MRVFLDPHLKSYEQPYFLMTALAITAVLVVLVAGASTFQFLEKKFGH
jgi:hypothetical protein